MTSKRLFLQVDSHLDLFRLLFDLFHTSILYYTSCQHNNTSLTEEIASLFRHLGHPSLDCIQLSHSVKGTELCNAECVPAPSSAIDLTKSRGGGQSTTPLARFMGRSSGTAT